MVKKTRKPGRPRKERSQNLSAQLSVRVPAALRDELQREAHRNRRKLSQEINARLSNSMKTKRLHRESDHTYWLGFAVRYLANGIEGTTEKSWLDDRYTFDAVVEALKIILAPSLPNGDVVLPDRIDADVKKRPDVYKQYEQPEGLASAFALGLITTIKTTPELPVKLPPNVHFSDTFYYAPKIRKAWGWDFIGPGSTHKETKT